MRTQKIYFPDRQTLCVFPNERSNLAQAISKLHLRGRHPVIVLIGGEIDEQQAEVTRRAIQTISAVAEDMNAVVICGGTDMGVMAEIGQIRSQKQYKFPLIGVAPEELVTWPGGPRSTKFLWWRQKRWQLEPHYSHFILVPGHQFGDESLWIFDTATLLSKGQRALTILINGGNISRKDIELSVKKGRWVIALDGTGRLANELAKEPNRHKLITIVPVNAEWRLIEVIRAAISPTEKIMHFDLKHGKMVSTMYANRHLIKSSLEAGTPETMIMETAIGQY